MPVSPQDFRLLKDDLPIRQEQGTGRCRSTSTGGAIRCSPGWLRYLPEQNAADGAVAVDAAGVAGPLAVKPGEDPNQLIPLSQTYVVEVELTDPNATIKPGQLAVVKIHAKWRSSAWWVGKTLANALDIGFY